MSCRLETIEGRRVDVHAFPVADRVCMCGRSEVPLPAKPRFNPIGRDPRRQAADLAAPSEEREDAEK